MTPQQILMNRFKTQMNIAKEAGTTRQAVSIAFARGRLSFQMATLLAKRMRIPVETLLTEWVPFTNRRARQSPHAKRRLQAIQQHRP
jgi:hypothetical protein